MIKLTTTAIEEVKRLLAKKDNASMGLRLGVRGGGCSGLSYQMNFGEKKEKDHEFQYDTVKVFIDPKSYLYLNGMQLDFLDDLKARGFKFVNPNAQKTCGCGESFSV